jgi:UDP-N-acetylmuramyl tripeptide synthase
MLAVMFNIIGKYNISNTLCSTLKFEALYKSLRKLVEERRVAQLTSGY